MSRLPDQFDLLMRKARECPDPARQLDYVLGTLAALREWYFLNTGTREAPEAAEAEIEGARCLLVFSDPGRVEELVGAEGVRPGDAPAVITIPTAGAMSWCVERRMGLLLNPGTEAVLVPFEQVEAFHTGWNQRGGNRTGFWIPNMTTQEEDFWQEQGL